MGRVSRAWVASFAVVAFAAVFQLFLRYQFIRGAGPVVYRYDRLTSSTCVAEPYDGCGGIVPTPAPTASADPDAAVHAIAYAQSASALMELPPRGYEWDASAVGDSTSTYYVSYTDAKGAGWFWQVDTRTGHADLVNGNAFLEKKFGMPTIAQPKPTNFFDDIPNKKH